MGRARAYLDRIYANEALRAFVFTDWTADGDGLAIAVKDNVDVRGMPTRAGGQHLPKSLRNRDADCVRRLRQSGCLVIGKTSLHEYALGVTSQNPHFGDVVNPKFPDLVAGGSSGGSAAAVAAGLCDAAIGTDTGGSVRLPAAFCGVVGYVPPRATVSRNGVFPISFTLDAVGVIGPSVAVAANVARLISSRSPLQATGARYGNVLRLAVPWKWTAGIDDDIDNRFRALAGHLPNVELPPREDVWAAHATVSIVDALQVHAEWLSAEQNLYGTDVRTLLETARDMRPIDYVRARRNLNRYRSLLRCALAKWDALLLPTAPSCPPRRGESSTLEARRRLTGWTRPLNVAEGAMWSIPVAGSSPMGLQVVADDETRALLAATRIEQHLAATASLNPIPLEA